MKIKWILPFLSALFLLSSASAQTEEETPEAFEQRLLQQLSDDTCPCLDSLLAQELELKELEEGTDLCAQKAFAKNAALLMQTPEMQELNAQEMSSRERFQAGQEVGTMYRNKLAPVLLSQCQSFFTIVQQLREAAPEAEEEEAKVLTGTIKDAKIEQGYAFIFLEEPDGTLHRVLWMIAFEGYDNFPKSPKECVGRSVKLAYHQISVYFPKEKAYQPCKMIAGMLEEE